MEAVVASDMSTEVVCVTRPNSPESEVLSFGIEAVTLEGFEKKGKGSPVMFYQMGRVLEGLFRSLNNLLERFHQSYFFYLLPATDRYISIGMYMPPLGLLCGGLLIKAFALWLKMQEDPVSSGESKDEKEDHGGSNEEKDRKGETKEEKKDQDKYTTSPVKVLEKQDVNSEQESRLSLVLVGVTLLATHALGVLLLAAPQLFSHWGTSWMGLNTDSSIYFGYLAVSVLILGLPSLTARNISSSAEACSLLNIVALLELATLLLAIAMHNFSLALICAVLYAPPALWIGPTCSRPARALQKLWWLMLHPLFLLTLVVVNFTAVTFPEEPIIKLLGRGLEASYQALMYAVVDSYIYGSWAYSVATAVLLPTWLLFWIVLHSATDTRKLT